MTSTNIPSINGAYDTQAQQAAKLTVSALKAVSLVGDATEVIVPSSYSFASTFDYRYHICMPERSKVDVGTADGLPWWYVLCNVLCNVSTTCISL